MNASEVCFSFLHSALAGINCENYMLEKVNFKANLTLHEYVTKGIGMVFIANLGIRQKKFSLNG